MENRLNKFTHFVLIFFLISFIGWLWEVILVYFLYGTISDRGILFLPICPIYGFTILTTFFLFGLPHKPSKLFIKIKNKYLLQSLYFLSVFILPTIFELIVGFIIFKAYHIYLWNYDFLPLSIGRYINIIASLFWAIGIFLIMRYLFPFILKKLEKMNITFSYVLSFFLITIFIADIIITLIISAK